MRPGGYLFLREIDFSAVTSSNKACPCRDEIIADETARKLMVWKKEAAAANALANTDAYYGYVPPLPAAPVVDTNAAVATAVDADMTTTQPDPEADNDEAVATTDIPVVTTDVAATASDVAATTLDAAAITD